MPNHVLYIPDLNVTIAKKCTTFPIEIVVRGYITGARNGKPVAELVQIRRRGKPVLG